MRIATFAVLLATAASGQTVANRVFQFTHTEDARNKKEIETTVRTIADIKDMWINEAQTALTVYGTQDQLKLAEWMFDQLDAPDPVSKAKHEFRMPGDGENVISLMYVRTASGPRDFQEIATAVRTVADIRRVFTYNAPMALVMRGTEDQIALAEWITNELDQPAGARTPAVHEYHMTSGFVYDISDIRVFYLAHTATVQDFQEVATAVRTIADIRQVFTYNAPRALVVRSTPGGVKLAAWLVDQLDTQNTGEPRQASPVYAYQPPTQIKDEGIAVRVFFLNHAGSTDDFRKAAVQVRNTAQIRRVFTYNAPRALVLRGTTDQLTVAEQLVKDIQ